MTKNEATSTLEDLDYSLTEYIAIAKEKNMPMEWAMGAAAGLSLSLNVMHKIKLMDKTLEDDLPLACEKITDD